ncbi:MAG: ATP-binding protein [Bacteroidetes bacterium]|nr:ATP-binding protein [Bacteroidota bacterium]
MNIYTQKIRWKFLLFVIAVVIGLTSLIYTQRLVRELKTEERKKVELWAKATKQLIELDITESDFEFLFEVIENNNTVPVILVGALGDTISTRNLDPVRKNNPEYLHRQLKKMNQVHEPIEIELSNGEKNYIYYKDSIILTKLAWFPFIQLGVIVLFIFVSYYAFSATRKAEQNQVWVGLSKETAHQLGTPTSSLSAWVELLRMKKLDEKLVLEFEKDVNRLEKITERFSKVGSKPALVRSNLVKEILHTVQYIKNRSSKKVSFEFNFGEDEKIWIPLNTVLFEWVIENLCKNALDAIGSDDGKIGISITNQTKVIYLDISDNGKGIPKSKFKTIFSPGYTTKERGWGLGLSLTKRIVEMYHGGNIFVKHSEINKGTTIRIILRK